MGRLPKLSDREVNRILAGRHPHRPDAEPLAAFVGAARSHPAVPPSIEALHLMAIVDSARKAAPAAAHPSAPARRRPRLRRTLVPAAVAASLVAKMAAASAAVLTVAGGLTAAGVLSEEGPAPVVEAEGGERGFLPAPLQEGSTASEHASQTAKDVLEVVDGWLAGGYSSGCAFGQAVAAAAGGQPRGLCPGADDGEHGRGRSAEAKAKAAEKSAEGKTKGAEKSAQGKAKAAENSQAGKAKGSEASSGGGNAPSAPPAGGGEEGGGGGSGGAPSGGSGGSANPGKP